MTKTRKAGDRGLGAEIRRLRKKAGLDVEELARRAGLDAEYIEELEGDEQIPPVGALLQISRALCLDAGRLLTRAEAEERRRRQKEGYERRRRSYAYKTLSPARTSGHLRAFLVTIEPEQDHDMVEYRHEGEEFLFVLDGKVDVTVGEKQYHLSKGKSLQFNSAVPHMLRNPGRIETRLIVVLYTP